MKKTMMVVVATALALGITACGDSRPAERQAFSERCDAFGGEVLTDEGYRLTEVSLCVVDGDVVDMEVIG